MKRMTMHRDREQERQRLAEFEGNPYDAVEHPPHFKPFEPTCSACKKIEEAGGYTSTLGVVHDYGKGCKHGEQGRG
jgi:lysyl-tRNA synthetase class I